MFESSIIIPVYNNWNFTRSCLRSLAANTERHRTEVIVVDNASSDVTPVVCSDLGRQLFGDSFRYERNEHNRDFAGASNQGARLARGDFLIFLNNDTEVLPGWHDPLLADFSEFANIAATGPLLLYPEQKIGGHTVQHLGVFITPYSKVGHLYEGIASTSPLAAKRRFFQAITAACMVIPRQLFMAAGMFDEDYRNGFEDIDLCARLCAAGKLFTVNPKARVIHHASQTPNRHAHEAANNKLLRERVLPRLSADWHLHLAADGFALNTTSWMELKVEPRPTMAESLVQRGANAAYEQLCGLLGDIPYWETGWNTLIELAPDPDDKLYLCDLAHKFSASPEMLLKKCLLAKSAKKKAQFRAALGKLDFYCGEPEQYLQNARGGEKWCRDMGLAELANEYRYFIEHFEEIKAQSLMPLVEMRNSLAEMGKK